MIDQQTSMEGTSRGQYSSVVGGGTFVRWSLFSPEAFHADSVMAATADARVLMSGGCFLLF